MGLIVRHIGDPNPIGGSAGTNPTVWTRELAFLGLAGTRGLPGPIEELFSFKTSPSLSKSDNKDQVCQNRIIRTRDILIIVNPTPC